MGHKLRFVDGRLASVQSRRFWDNRLTSCSTASKYSTSNTSSLALQQKVSTGLDFTFPWSVLAMSRCLWNKRGEEAGNLLCRDRSKSRNEEANCVSYSDETADARAHVAVCEQVFRARRAAAVEPAAAAAHPAARWQRPSTSHFRLQAHVSDYNITATWLYCV